MLVVLVNFERRIFPVQSFVVCVIQVSIKLDFTSTENIKIFDLRLSTFLTGIFVRNCPSTKNCNYEIKCWFCEAPFEKTEWEKHITFNFDIQK